MSTSDVLDRTAGVLAHELLPHLIGVGAQSLSLSGGTLRSVMGRERYDA